jgi:radical SAM-linked protein
MVGHKVRLRFSKAGDLRLLSHHDLMRCGERMLRRAALPFKMTGGFHPTPRLVFALSLPLGVVGRDEVVELELNDPLAADEVRDRLTAQAPAGLTFHAAKLVDPKANAVPRRVEYRLALPADRVPAAAEACANLMHEAKVWADRYKPRPRRVNVRPFLRRLAVEPLSPSPNGRGVGEGFGRSTPPPSPLSASGRGGRTDANYALRLDLWVTGTGTARCDELIRLLGLADLPDAGAVLERTALEVHDETPPGQPDAPPDGPAETLPLEPPPGAVPGEDEPATADATWGLSPNGPAVE